MTLKSIRHELKRRHLNPKIAKGLVAVTMIGSMIVGGGSYYHSHKTMAEAASMTEEAKTKIDVYNNAVKNYENAIERFKEANDKLLAENASLKSELEELRREVNGGYSTEGGFEVEVTAYTLSESSCNKGVGHPGYGLTANGTNLAGHTLESARAIAVDPNVIPLGSKVQVVFKDASMKQYNGVYTACDTGGAIKGNIIDLFAGENAEDLAMNIGRRIATVKIL
jgi:3D (Asp-Asp-Asp) domain-containing protein